MKWLTWKYLWVPPCLKLIKKHRVKEMPLVPLMPSANNKNEEEKLKESGLL